MPKHIARRNIALLAAGLALLSPAVSRGVNPTPPSLLFGDLFRNVADSGLFRDFKVFADATPKRPPAVILAAYHANQPTSRQALRQFIETNFSFDRDQNAALPPPPGLPLLEHIARLWPHLTKSSQNPPPYSSALPLPEPYVVPGGRFHELYYWDSYFTMLGFGSAQETLKRGIIADFVSELHRYGHIPNGSRSYYLSRSQPPFFFKMVALAAPGRENQAYARFLPELKVEYAYWMADADKAVPGRPVRHVVRMPDGSVLNRYWDERAAPRDEVWPVDVDNARTTAEPLTEFYRNVRAAAESGWDFSSRWFADGRSVQTIDTTAIVPPDLNSILFGLERAIEEGCRWNRDYRCAREFATRARARRAAMNRYQWNGKVFDDYRWTDGKRLGHVSCAAYYALFFGVATPQQAHKTEIAASKYLLERGGLMATPVNTGQQWDAPNGWAPLQWIAVIGLRDYGERNDARAIACRWLANVNRVYTATGKLLEKYDVVSDKPGGGGEYPLQDGFGWTNGVTAALARLYPHC
jgi:alpha,alpha-trehalase